MYDKMTKGAYNSGVCVYTIHVCVIILQETDGHNDRAAMMMMTVSNTSSRCQNSFARKTHPVRLETDEPGIDSVRVRMHHLTSYARV